MAYCTVAELRAHLNIDDSIDDDTLLIAVDTGSQQIDDYCGRTFTVPTATSTRTLPAEHPRFVRLPFDLANTTSLVVKTDDNDDGTFETTWTITTDFEVGPRSYGLNGQAAWPYTTLTAVGGRTFPVHTARQGIQIVGNLGWAAVPTPVKYAALLQSAELWKLRDAVFGVAGFGEFGALRVRENPKIAMLLSRYRSGTNAAMIA